MEHLLYSVAILLVVGLAISRILYLRREIVRLRLERDEINAE